MSIGQILANILAALVLKLTCSSDDLAWLTPFLIHRRYLALFYLIAMEIVVAAAITLSTVGKALLDLFTEEGSYWDSNRILGLASAIGLSMFSMFLFYEYYTEIILGEEVADMSEASSYPNSTGKSYEFSDDFPEDNEKVGNDKFPHSGSEDYGDGLPNSGPEDCAGGLLNSGSEDCANKSTFEEKSVDITSGAGYTSTLSVQAGETGETEIDSSKFTPWRVIITTLMGSFDDVVVQAAILSGGNMIWYQLAIGIGLGSSIVALICMFIGSFQWVKQCLHKVPVFLIIGLFAIYSYICTFTGFDL